MQKSTILLCLLLVAGGVWTAYNWEEIRYVAGVEQRPGDRAIDLAQSGHALDRLVSNEDVLRERLDGLDILEVIGWDARVHDNLTYLVRFRYRESGIDGELTYHFEVNMETEHVRNIEDDPELCAKYGVPARPR